MKALFSICLSLYLISSFGQTKNLVTERILYTVRLDDNSGKDGGHYQHLDNKSKNHIIDQLCSLVFYDKLNAYYCSDIPNADTRGQITGAAKEICFSKNNNLNGTTNAQSLHLKFDPLIRREDCVYRDLISKFAFQEEWYFNEIKNRFDKIINGLFIVGDNVGRSDDYYLDLNDSTTNRFYSKNLIAKDIVYDVPITRTATDGQCNDLNWWYNYLETSKREKLLYFLIQKATYDTSTLALDNYNPNFPYSKLISKSSEEYRDIYMGRSQKLGSDPEMFDRSMDDFMSCCYELGDWRTIRKLRFHENWFFDSEELRFEKQVLGIGMIVDKYNKAGQIIGDTCLVYYKMNP